MIRSSWHTRRHCEERRDEAIQGNVTQRLSRCPGLLRFARNDGMILFELIML
jgi:hypothetical protein